MEPQYVSFVISLFALLVAAYGIYERRSAAARVERVRLSAITDDLEKLKLELIAEAESVGDRVEALHSRMELLAQQGLSLLREHGVHANSTECRSLAYLLDEISYTDDANEVWVDAVKQSWSEGNIQILYATRGYSYYLFRHGRQDEARQRLNSATNRIPPTDDVGRLLLAETFSSWAYWEARMFQPDRGVVNNLLERIRTLANECESPRKKEQIEKLCFDLPGDSSLDEHD